MDKIFNILIDLRTIRKNPDTSPMYLYKYIPTKVECIECNKVFKHTELGEVWHWNGADGDMIGEEEYSSSVICPSCGESDCCNFKYESVGGALNRKRTGTFVKN